MLTIPDDAAPLVRRVLREAIKQRVAAMSRLYTNDDPQADCLESEIAQLQALLGTGPPTTPTE
jgi:hypothetical protein